MTINELIAALQHVPEHLRDSEPVIFDDSEVELIPGRVHTLLSGTVVIDVSVNSIGIGEASQRIAGDDLSEIRSIRKLHQTVNDQ